MTDDVKPLLQDWIRVYENQLAGLPVDPEAIEALVARSKDFIDKN